MRGNGIPRFSLSRGTGQTRTDGTPWIMYVSKTFVSYLFQVTNSRGEAMRNGFFPPSTILNLEG